jgi:hypothetical protein
VGHRASHAQHLLAALTDIVSSVIGERAPAKLEVLSYGWYPL